MKYTPDEVAKLLANQPNQPHYIEALIGKCVKAAVLAEREACATIDVTPLNILASDGPGTAILKYRAAIRARGGPATREERRAHDERYLRATVEQTRTGRFA